MTSRSSCLALTFILAGLPGQGPDAATHEVLFLGNSYTASNDLPGLVYELALCTQDTLIYDSNTPGGCTLGYPPNGHTHNEQSLQKINDRDWDFVVLQEQSQFPVIRYYRDNYMYPGARSLDSLIELNNPTTETVFFMTWGRKHGGQQTIGGYSSPDFVDFRHMQDSLETAYWGIANELGAPVALVGIAWKNSILSGDPIELFAPDGSHPSRAGSYLAACVFYATMLQKDPLGLPYTGGLTSADAAWLQLVASETVLGGWNIPVELSSFSAMVEEGSIVLRWTTQSEADNLGFHVWRAADGGAFRRITGELIPGAGTSPTPTSYSYRDCRLPYAETVRYRLESLSVTGTSECSESIEVAVPGYSGLGSSVAPGGPNPSRSTAVIRCRVPRPCRVELAIYDALGRRVRTLLSQSTVPGIFEAPWDGTAEDGGVVDQGIYFARLTAAGRTTSARLILLR